MQKFDVEKELEKEILDAARKTVQTFRDDYDPRNPTDRENARVKQAIIDTVKQQAEILRALGGIAATLEKLVKSIR